MASFASGKRGHFSARHQTGANSRVPANNNSAWSKSKARNRSNKTSSRAKGKGSRFGQTLGTDRRARSLWNQAVSKFQYLLTELENDIEIDTLIGKFNEILERFKSVEYPAHSIPKTDCSSIVRGLCNIFQRFEAKYEQLDEMRPGGLQVFKALSVGVTQESFDDIKKRVCEFIEYITMKQKVEYGAADLGDIIPFLVKQVSHTRSISSIQSLAAVLKEHNSRCTTHYKLILDKLLDLVDDKVSEDEVVRGALFAMANLCGSGNASTADGNASAALREGLKAAGGIRVFLRTSSILQSEHTKYVSAVKRMQNMNKNGALNARETADDKPCNPALLSSAMRTFAAIIFALPSVLDSDAFGINLTTILHDFLNFRGMHKIISAANSNRPSSTNRIGTDSDTNFSDSDTDGHSFWSSTKSHRVSINLHSLSALLAVSRSKPKYLLERWVHYIPERSHSWSASSSFVNKRTNRRRERYRSLIDIMINERSWRLRSAATCLIISMIEAAPLVNWLPKQASINHQSTATMSPSRTRQRTQAFIPMSTRVTNSINTLHEALYAALRKESNVAVLSQLFRCATTTFHRVPYDQMPTSVQKTIYNVLVHAVKYTCEENCVVDQSVRSVAFNLIGSAVSTKCSLVEVDKMLSASNGKIAPEDSNPSYSNSDDSSVAEVAAAASRLHVSLNNTDTPKKKVWIPPHRRAATPQSKSRDAAPPSSAEGKEHVMVMMLQNPSVNPSILFVLAKMARTYPKAVASWWNEGLLNTVLSAFSSRDNRVRENAIKVVDPLCKSDLELDGLPEIIMNHIVRALSDTNNGVRTSALQLVQGISRNEWCAITEETQIEILRLVSFSFHDNAPKVRTAAAFVVGTYVMHDWIRNEETLRTFAIDIMATLRKEETLVVVSRCAWALANLCSCLTPKQENNANDLDSQHITDTFVTSKQISDVVVSLAKDYDDQSQTQDKIRTSSIRALGSLGQYWAKQSIDVQEDRGKGNNAFQTVVSRKDSKKNQQSLNYRSNSEPAKADARTEIDMLNLVVCALLKFLNSGTPKTTWNACHALGGIYEASCVHHKFGFLSQQTWHKDGLRQLMRCMKSSNFKVRINAITATRSLHNKADFPKTEDEDLFEAFRSSVVTCLENLDKDTDFAQYQYKEILQEQCKLTVEHLDQLIS